MKPIFGAELIPNVEKFAHCSSIIELPNGNLMVSSYAGTGEHNPDTKIYTIIYDKTSRKWLKPEIRVNTPNKSDGNAILFPVSPPAKINEAIDAAVPTQIVVTGD